MWSCDAGFGYAVDSPFGLTLVGDSFQDARLLAIGAGLEQILRPQTQEEQDEIPPFKDPAYMYLAVGGAHMAGLPLNHQLTGRGAVMIEATESRLEIQVRTRWRPDHATGYGSSERGWTRNQTGDLAHALGGLSEFCGVDTKPLGIGTVETASGTSVLGFICEQAGLVDATDITEFGGWRSFLASKSQEPQTPSHSPDNND